MLTVTPKIASGFFKILFAAWRMFEIHHTHESVMGENFDWWKIWGQGWLDYIALKLNETKGEGQSDQT